MFHRDTFRLIKKTFRRFFTIFLMVFIGVAFMVGLLSSYSIMEKSVDIYYDEYNFMDVQLYSSYGFDDNDVKAMEEAETVDKIFATKFVDVLGMHKDLSYVTRVQEIDANVNQFELLSGRMPENSQEALTLGSSSFGVVFEEGETVKLYLDEGKVKDSLKYEEYTIVGTVRSAQYMASTKETSNLDNLNLEAVIYVDNNDFKADYYTSMYLTLKGSQNLVSFTDEYKTYVDGQLESLQEVIDVQQNHRKDEILEESLAEIKKAENKLTKEKNAAQKQLNDAKKQLDKAKKQLEKGEKEIAENEKKLDAGEVEIAENLIKLDEAKKELEAAIKQLEQESGKSFEETVEQINGLYTVYVKIEKIIEDTDQSVTIQEKINANLQEIARLEAENVQYELQIIQMQLEGASDIDIAGVRAKINVNKIHIGEIKAENAFLTPLLSMYENSSLKGILKLLDQMAGGSVKDSYNGIQQLLTAEKQIEDGYKEIEKAKQDIKDGRAQIESAKLEIALGWIEYYKGVDQWEAGQRELEEKIEDAQVELNKAKQALDELPDAKWMVLDRDMHYSTAMYAGSANQMQTIGSIVPLLFFLVAALVCMTTMMRLIEEERSQIGVFSALGFNRGQIISKYVIYAFVASVLGSALGVVAGIPIFPNVIYWAWKLMYDTPDVYLYLPVSAAVIGALSFTLLMMIVTFFVVRKSLNQMPSQLMRPKAPKSTKKVFLENIPGIWNHLSFTSKVTARNLIRYKSRFFMTVIGVAGCTSLLVLGFGIKDSIAAVIDIQYSEILLHDHVVKVEDYKQVDSVLTILEEEDNHEIAVPYMFYSSKVYLDSEEKTISVYVMDPSKDAMVSLKNRRTKEELSIKDGVVISEKFAKNHNLSVGDMLKIESSNGIKQNVEISGICEMYFQHYLFISDDYYYETFGESMRSEYIAVQPMDSDQLFSSLENVKGVESITDFSDAKKSFTSMIDALDLIVLVVLIAAGSLAFVVLMNLSEVNISERMREIATLKVLGFNDKEVNSYIFKEIFLLSLIGACVGMPLGKLELILVMNIIDMDMVMFGTEIQPLSYVYGFVITIIFALIVLFFMRGSLKKVEMVESLKSVE